MFRRKEETADDPSHPHTASAAAPAASTHSEASSPNASSLSAMTAAAPSAGGSPYVPVAPVARAATEPARPAAPMNPAGSYRPAPIAEFNRGAARPAEAMRSAVPSVTSAFAGASDKTGAAKSNRRVLTVGNDILLKGEIATCDRLVIEGRVEAKLSEVHTVEIAECGSFKGTAEVEDAEISGVFEGDLIVRNRLVVYATGEVRGNIGYGEIEIERGGKLTGQIKTAGSAGTKGNANAAQDKQQRPKETAAA